MGDGLQVWRQVQSTRVSLIPLPLCSAPLFPPCLDDFTSTMAGVHNGYLLEFPQIRVDCFTTRPRSNAKPWMLPCPTDPTHLTPARPAQLYLLTHVHTDHLTGLGDNFTGRIVCSIDTKRMLLRLEEQKERKAVHEKTKETAKRKYEGLQPVVLEKGTKYERVVDHIVSEPHHQRLIRRKHCLTTIPKSMNSVLTTTAKRYVQQSPCWTPTIALDLQCKLCYRGV